MAVTKKYERQKLLYAMVDLGIANMGTNNGQSVGIPRGAMALDVGLFTETAFNSATTSTGSVGDGTTVFVNAQDVKTTGIETVAVAGKFYATGGTITFSLAETGATATTGRAIGYVGYIQLGNFEFVQK